MATNVIMPALGMDQETGILVRWIKREGERVEKGEPIMEVETDKVVVEIEATASGVLASLTATEGDEVPVGQVIARILDHGEARDTVERETPPTSGVAVASTDTRPEPVEGRARAPIAPSNTRLPPGGPRASRALASPKARQAARTASVDLAGIQGSGPEGAILAADVVAAQPPWSSAAEAAATLGPPGSATARPEPVEGAAVLGASAPSQPPTPDLQPLSRVWRVMAERMAASWTTAPHFVLAREVLASALVQMREGMSSAVERRGGAKPTYTDLLVKITAEALRNHPHLNASWAEGGIRFHSAINIGIATAIEDGLVVPVIRDVGSLSFGEVAARRATLVERANEGRLTPDDVTGGTFTITNLGMYGVDAFNAIINPPQAAILAVGRIADRVVAVEGQPAVRPTAILTLSCDHRAVDGVRAARFLDELAALIEEPWGLLA